MLNKKSICLCLLAIALTLPAAAQSQKTKIPHIQSTVKLPGPTNAPPTAEDRERFSLRHVENRDQIIAERKAARKRVPPAKSKNFSPFPAKKKSGHKP